MHKNLPSSELSRRRAELKSLAQTGLAEAGAEDPALLACFSLSTPEGRQLYESFSNAQLLDLLRENARALGRSPTQKETFWVYRSYLRCRFKNWPTALRMAGLSRSAGKGGPSLETAAREEQARQELLSQVRSAAKSLGRMPHPSDLPEVCQGLKKSYHTWGDVLTASGAVEASFRRVCPIEDLEENYRAMLEDIRLQAEDLNRAPQHKEVPPEVRSALIRRCGSWRNALYQIGLEPVRRISPFSNTSLNSPGQRPQTRHRGTLYDCYYRILHLDKRTTEDLALVKKTARRLGRAPTRNEIPTKVRRQLQDACGSWSNALYQLDLHPRRKNEGKEITRIASQRPQYPGGHR